jgi:hypothetical protein
MLIAAMPAAAVAAKNAPLAQRRLRVEVSRLERSLKETSLLEARIMLGPSWPRAAEIRTPEDGGHALRSGLAG